MKTKFFLSTLVALFIVLGLSFSATARFKIENNPPLHDLDVFIYVSPGAIITGDSNISFGKREAIIYVSPNTIIYGQENYSKTKIYKATKEAVKKKNTIDDLKPFCTSKEFVVINKLQDKSTQQLQDRLNKEVENTFYTSTANQKYYKWAEIMLSNQISSSSATPYNAFFADVSSESENTITPPLIRHKIYNFFCHLEFPKLRNDVLRGPPTI